MEHLARILEARQHGERQPVDHVTTWKAVKAIIDDFIEKAWPFGPGDPDSCKLTVVDGPIPRFKFSPYAAVATAAEATATDIPTGAWEEESAIVIGLIEKISGLVVTWDKEEKVFYLSHPVLLRETENAESSPVAPSAHGSVPAHPGQSGRPGLRSRQPDERHPEEAKKKK